MFSYYLDLRIRFTIKQQKMEKTFCYFRRLAILIWNSVLFCRSLVVTTQSGELYMLLALGN